MKILNFKGKELVLIEKIDTEFSNYSNNYIENTSNYSVKIGNGEMMFQVLKDQNSKIFWLFDTWEISSKGMIKEYTINVPIGSKLYVDGEKINTKNNGNLVLEAFPGKYEIKAVLEGEEKEVDFDTSKGSYVAIDFDKVQQINENVSSMESENSENNITELEDPNNNPEIKVLIDKYQEKLIKAINTKDFTIISPMLVYGSDLYIDNQELVSKGYKEKLIKCDLVDYFYENGIYHIFTNEEIEIKTLTDKDYKKVRYEWEYTLENEFGEWKFSKIEKWEL